MVCPLQAQRYLSLSDQRGLFQKTENMGPILQIYVHSSAESLDVALQVLETILALSGTLIMTE